MFGINSVLFRFARDRREAGGDLRRMSNLRHGPRGFCRPWFTTNVKRAALGSAWVAIADGKACEVAVREKPEKGQVLSGW
jgi:hypothetical protein